MVLIARKNGFTTQADFEQVIAHYAKQTGVKVQIIDVMAEPVFVEVMGSGMDGSPRCVASTPTMMDRLPMDKKLSWAEMMRTCSYPEWVVGFSANVKARVGLYSSTQYVEHFFFLTSYAPTGQ
jgi:hypothetical protein